MHEVGIMQSALASAERLAREGGASEITRLVLRIGSLSSVVPESLQSAFHSLARDSMAHSADLDIEWVEAMCYCVACKKEFEFKAHGYFCPWCQQASLSLQCGRELEIKTIEWR